MGALATVFLLLVGFIQIIYGIVLLTGNYVPIVLGPATVLFLLGFVLVIYALFVGSPSTNQSGTAGTTN